MVIIVYFKLDNEKEFSLLSSALSADKQIVVYRLLLIYFGVWNVVHLQVPGYVVVPVAHF